MSAQFQDFLKRRTENTQRRVAALEEEIHVRGAADALYEYLDTLDRVAMTQLRECASEQERLLVQAFSAVVEGIRQQLKKSERKLQTKDEETVTVSQGR